MQLLEQFAMGVQGNHTMENVMPNVLLEINSVMRRDGHNPPSAFFVEEKKVMEEIWKWAKADTVKENNGVWDRIVAQIEIGRKMTPMPMIHCSKGGIKADLIREGMNGMGYYQCDSVTGMSSRSNEMFFAKKFSGEYSIVVGITVSHVKNTDNINDMTVFISYTKRVDPNSVLIR